MGGSRTLGGLADTKVTPWQGLTGPAVCRGARGAGMGGKCIPGWGKGAWRDDSLEEGFSSSSLLVSGCSSPPLHRGMPFSLAHRRVNKNPG